MEKCGSTTQIHTKKCKDMQIRRKIEDRFLTWKESENRKPILLQGARQIGKTWVMEQFGKEHYDYCVTFDFDKHPEYKDVFANTKDPERILKELSVYSRVPLLPEKTLIIFDEIQECEEALNCLKYFYEDAPQYHIVAAGSLLGVAVKKRRMSVPVGKVKIDKSLVDNYLVEGKDTFIKNIARLVHDLGMKLTVEGIEWQWQYERLKKLHCDYIQGYYFARPMTGVEVERFCFEWQSKSKELLP